MQNRNLAIDAYRGLTIAFMLIVNTPGTWDYVFPVLRHADWDGCTPTDLVFPSFLFIVGASMWYAYKKYDHQLSPAVSTKIIKRTALIFLIGLLLNWFPFYDSPLSNLRILGVLQRIALAFGLGAFLCLGLSRKWLIRVAVLLLLGYWALLYFLGTEGAPYGLEGNLVRKVDLWLFGAGHLWDGKGIAFDPEGLLSTIPSAVTVIMGWLSANILTHFPKKPGRAVFYLLAFGVLNITIALFWDLTFPINKSLWTSSYVLYSGGWSMFLLAAMTWIYDEHNMRFGFRFLDVFGKNPLFAYVLSGVLVKILCSIQIFPMSFPDRDGPVIKDAYIWIYDNIFAQIEAANVGSFLFAFSFMLFCWLICWLLYRKNIFVKI